MKDTSDYLTQFFKRQAVSSKNTLFEIHSVALLHYRKMKNTSS